MTIEKGRDLTQAPTLRLYQQSIHYKHSFNTKTPHKSISHRLLTDLIKNGQSEKKEEIWLSPMTKAPTPTEMSKGLSENTNNVTKKCEYTAVADRLRTVSWSNYSHPTGVVNLVYGPNLPTPRNSRVIKRTHIYIDNKPTATPSGEVIKIDTRKA